MKSEAIGLGLCPKWQRNWAADSSAQELIDKYKKGIDFCIQNDFPSNEFIIRNFSRELLEENLIFVDEYLDVQNAADGIYILNGSCGGQISFGEWSTATLFMRHDSSVKVYAAPFSKLFIRLYDGAEVDVDASEDASVRVLDRR